ncbi:ABC transporter permease [Myxococcota bacterium]|nr:ABC transporter permease [Myxococcota bacterium]MCZ7619999.1 ABC transporter permease [Myxococcota bacterium]
MEAHVATNLVVLLLLVVAGFLAWRLPRNRYWRERLVEIRRRRPLALLGIALYVGVALLDAVSWREELAAESEAASPGLLEARSALERLFPADFQEASYSAPLAEREFYGGAPLRHPRRHLLGTDILGRDVLLLTLQGARVALLVGGLTCLIAIPLALLAGVPAGWFGGRLDDLVFFVVSTLASMPSILLLIALVTAIGRGPLQVCFALAVTGWVGFCRLARGETLKLRELDYVQAARALGVSEWRILWRHILPNLTHLVVITFVLTFSQLVLSEAVLSWLGLGLDGSWGQMIDQARDELSRDPVIGWNLGAASGALFVLILCVNRVGDAVRDVLDPRTVRERA